MSSLKLDVRFDGFADRVGILARDNNGNASFTYDDAYVAIPVAIPISLALPLTEKPYGDQQTKSYFENLLQEGDSQTKRVRDREGLATGDFVGLLTYMGKDCPGALSVVPEGTPPVKVPGDFSADYDPFSESELQAIVISLRTYKTMPKESADPSPLAGVQSKFAFAILPNGQYAFPKPGSGAPTTHIIKVPGAENEKDARYEVEAMRLTKLVNRNTAEARLLSFAGIEVIELERFDRSINERGQVIRIHQEDFAQSLGLPVSLKYERNGKDNRKFDAHSIGRILSQTETPALAREEFIAATLSDLMLGNIDGHAKNFSLLYVQDRPVLSPRYDVLPTMLNPTFTDELSFTIGNAKRIMDIQRDDLRSFLHAIGVTGKPAQARILHRLGNTIAEKHSQAFEGLADSGMKLFADLIATYMRHLLPLLETDIPHCAVNRDAFVVRGGGWANS